MNILLTSLILQEKVAAAKANSELSSVTAELTRALAEAENLRYRLGSSKLSEDKDTEGDKNELEKMLTHCQQLEANIKVQRFILLWRYSTVVFQVCIVVYTCRREGNIS